MVKMPDNYSNHRCKIGSFLPVRLYSIKNPKKFVTHCNGRIAGTLLLLICMAEMCKANWHGDKFTRKPDQTSVREFEPVELEWRIGEAKYNLEVRQSVWRVAKYSQPERYMPSARGKGSTADKCRRNCSKWSHRNCEAMIEPSVKEIAKYSQPEKSMPRAGSVRSKYSKNRSKWSPSQVSNKQMYTEQGNKGMKIYHQNKGPSHLATRFVEIKQLVMVHNPDVLGLSEANLKATHDHKLVEIEGYTMLTTKAMENPSSGWSRLVVYVKNTLSWKRRPDLENQVTADIWIEAALGRQKPVIIANIYREWGLAGQGGDMSSRSDGAQVERWDTFTSSWENALGEDREVLVLGDVNFDRLRWDTSTQGGCVFTESLHEKILPLGVSQLLTSPSRIGPNMFGQQEESGLDHLYTNKPEKLVDIELKYNGLSDHKYIKLVRKSKCKPQGPRETRKRQYKNFCNNDFKRQVQEVDWSPVMECVDVNLAVEKMMSPLNEILDKSAPVRTIQTRRNFAPYLSKSTKAKMVERGVLQQAAAESKKDEDLAKYRRLRNQVLADQRQDKKDWEAEKLDNLKHDSAKLWSNVKNWLGWSSGGPPSSLNCEQSGYTSVTSPKKIA